MDFSQAWASARALIDHAMTLLPLAIAGLIAFALFHLLGWALGNAIRRAARRWRTHPNLAIVLGRLTRWGIGLLGLLVALMITLPGFRPAQLVSILGLGSVAVGFAFRDILQNFLAGLLILLQEPFRIGDQIVASDFEGTVENIETRATFIRTYDNRRVVIPNAVLFTSAVTVNTAYEVRRIEYDVGIGYGDDMERARSVILETLAAVPDVLDDPAPDVLCMELAESALKLRVRWWIRPPARRDALESRDRVLSAIKRALRDAGVDMPFQTMQVLLHDQTEEVDGDRERQREGWPPGEGPSPRPRRERLVRVAEPPPRSDEARHLEDEERRAG